MSIEALVAYIIISLLIPFSWWAAGKLQDHFDN